MQIKVQDSCHGSRAMCGGEAAQRVVWARGLMVQGGSSAVAGASRVEHLVLYSSS